MLVWTLKRCRSRPRPRSPSPSPPVPLPLAAAPCGAVPSGMLTTWLSWALPRPSAQALLARCAARARAAPGAPEREWAESPPTPCFSSPVPKWARKWMKTALGQVSPCLSRLFKAFFPWISERTAAKSPRASLAEPLRCFDHSCGVGGARRVVEGWKKLVQLSPWGLTSLDFT